MSDSPAMLYAFALDLGGYAVRMAASVMGKSLAIQDVDVLPGSEHLSDAMLARNPKATLPVLEDGDLVLTEPGAIVVHLAGDTSFSAESPRALDLAMSATTLLSLFSQLRHRLLFDQSNPTSDAALELMRAEVSARFRQFEDHMTVQGLRGEEFLLGGSPSAADLIAFPAFAQSRDLAIEPEAYPALRLWARRIRALPGFIGMPGIPDYH